MHFFTNKIDWYVTLKVYASLESNDDNFDMNFNLSTYGIPEGWNASLDNNSIFVEKFSLSEVNLTVTAPQNGVLPSDQDMDGLSNTLEINLYNTSILNPDTDNDMIWDGAEVNYWLLRGLSTENISLYLNNNDIDGDGLLDGDEIIHLTNINGSSDNDALSDFHEVHQYFTYEKIDINMDYYPPPPFNISIEFEINVEDDYRLMLDIRNQINTTISEINDTESVINQIMENITIAKISGEEVDFNTFGTPMEIYDLGNGSFNVTDSRYYAIYKQFEPDDYNLTLQIDSTSYENTSIYLINVSVFRIQRHGLDPFDGDVDNDGLNDSYEVYRGINPFKVDTDEDGLNDYDEVAIYNSNPTKIDTDYDGLADGYNVTINEISYEGELSYGTDSTDPDTDSDGLSDGYNITINGVNWIGELAIGTNPNIWDTDSDTMPDGWENKYDLNPLDSNDANIDNDNGGADGLTNAQEYTVGTVPTDNDSDDDNLTDGNEITGVVFRTNITKGADCIDYYIDYYENQTGFKWIFYNGSNYELKDGYTNVSNTSSARYNGTEIELISVLSDGTTLLYNITTDEIFVWEPGSDFDDSDQNGTLEGTFYAFNSSNSSEPITSNVPEPGFKYQEIYKGTSPWINDTDEDGIFDGDEKNCTSDTDDDGLPNNLDTDSDNDGVIDGEEIGWDQNNDGDSILYNMLDSDSDNDGILDGTESLWYLDVDKDGLENMIDSDSDNDNLNDGVEDWNYNGTLDANETSMIDVDTDNDGIIDSIELDWNISSDNDTLINACDTDSDNDGVTDGNEIRVVYRTNAVNGEYNGSTWIALALNESAWNPDTEPPYGYNLTGFWYNSSSASPIGILLGYTFENDEIRYDEINETVYVNTTKFLINTSSQIIKSTKPTLMFTKNRGETIVFYNTSDGDIVFNMLDNDSDDDNLIDGLEDLDNDGIIDLYETDPYMQDSDMDGLPDGVEDSDLNGSRNSGETDPLNVDSDGDSLWDGWKDLDGDSVYDPFEYGEDKNANGTLDIGETDPLKLDTDEDLLRDDFEMIEDVFWMEAEMYMASGAQKNSSENSSTGSEIEFNTLSNGTYQMCVMAKSVIADTLLTFEVGNATSVILGNKTVTLEITYHWYNTSSFNIINTDLPIKLKAPSTGPNANLMIDKIMLIRVDSLNLKNVTNPSDDDSDDDGLSDANEKFITQTYPFDFDSDGDGIQDGTELGITNPQGSDTADTFKPDQDSNSTTNPLKMDTDNDGLPDGWIDYNEDRYPQALEGEDFGCDGKLDTYDIPTGGVILDINPLKLDSDKDGLNDTREVRNNVYWFEAEYNMISGATMVDNDSASTGVKITMPDPSICNGSYMYFVKAKTIEEDTELTFGVYDTPTMAICNKTITLTDKYLWYNTSAFNITKTSLPIYLYAPYPNANSNIYIEKVMLIRISNITNYAPFVTNASNSSIMFTGPENQTIYIDIPENMYVKSAKVDLVSVPVPLEEFQITMNEWGQIDPKIYGDKIVWFNSSNDYVYMYDLNTDTETQITTDVSFGHSIYGDKIVYTQCWDIYMYDISTGIETQIETEESTQKNPVIYGTKIVWQDDRNGNLDIYMYDLSTGKETPICTHTSKQECPDIYENRIIWLDDRNCSWDRRKIYMYDLITSTETQINISFDVDRSAPYIYRDKIVWENYSSEDIYMYDLSTDTEIKISKLSVPYSSPYVYNDKIVWEDNRNGNWDIYMYDIRTGREAQITTDGSLQWNPYIYGDKIVWEDSRNGNWDIYMCNLSYVTNLTFNIGNDTNIEWYYTEKFFGINSPSDFADEINKYIFNNRANFTNGKLSVPLTFNSYSPGRIDISDLYIVLAPDVFCPMDNDTDSDKLLDGYERDIYYTHSLSVDSDNDMLHDFEEIMGADEEHRVGTHPAHHDTDNDGLWDGFEDINHNGVFDPFEEVGEDINVNYHIDINETNPLDPDSDNDNLIDGIEFVSGVMWFEAENYSIGQTISDINASGGFSVENYTGIELIDEDLFPSPPNGDYILYVRAKSNHTIMQDMEYFSSGIGDWVINKTGSGTEINANLSYLKVIGSEGEHAFTTNTAVSLPSSSDYKIEFDFKYPSGSVMNRFLVWGVYESSKPDIEIWQSNDGLYANDDPIAFASLTNTVWHHFEIISVYDDTFEIYLDEALVYSSTKVENCSTEIFGKIGDTAPESNGTGNWDNIGLTEISHINVTVRMSSSNIHWEIFPVFEEYQWYQTSPFTIENDESLKVDINDSNSSNSTAYVDKLMLFKIKETSALTITTTSDLDDVITFGEKDNITVNLDLKVKESVPLYVSHATIEIYGFRYGVSTDFGTNIGVNDYTTNNQRHASIAVDNNGDIYIVWEDYRSGTNYDIYFTKSTDGGASFSTSLKVNDDGGSTHQFYPSIALDNNSNIYVVWHDYRSGTDYDIYFAKSTDGGASFSSNIKVSDDSGNYSQYNPSITATNSGNIYVTWYDLRNGDYDIYFANSTDGGANFSSNIKVNDDTGNANQYYPSITVDSNGNIYIAWEDRRNDDYDIYFANSTDGGSSFGTNIKVNDDSGTAAQYRPSVTVDDSGDIYIAWSDYRDTPAINIYFAKSTDSGGSFGTNVKVNYYYPSGDQELNPSIAVDGNSNIFIAWQENRNDDGDICVARSFNSGTTFSDSVKINDDEGNTVQYQPAIAADDSGVYVVWHDFRNDNDYDIYFATNCKYPTYPYLNLGDYDNISIPRANLGIKDYANCSLESLEKMTLPQWAWYYGEFTPQNGTQRILDLSGELNQYIKDNINQPGMVNDSGYLRIPLEFHSDTAGKLVLSYILIVLVPYVTDALDNDTDGDWLRDCDENLIWTSSLKQDSDNDGLWDIVEPVKGIGTDPLDSDTENDLLMDGNLDELKVIFRSGSSNGVFINYTENTWIAIQKLVWIGDLSNYTPVSEYSRLLGYGFDRNATSLPGEYAPIIFNTTEDYELFYINSTSEIYVKLGESDYKVYNLSDDDAHYAINFTSPQLKYAIDNREVYSNAALTADKDNDGLIDGIEPSLGLTPSDADWDDDGLLDGMEYYLVGSNPKDNDTDNDGLWDGLEMGVTLADVWEIRWNLEVNELIYGTDLSVFTGHYDFDPNSKTDPLMSDTDKDGIWDGFKDLNDNGAVDPNEPGEDRNLNGLSYNENETDPVNPDTDGDGLSDGFGENSDGDIYLEQGETNPMDIDTDDDGLWDGYSINYNGTLYLGELSYGTEQLGNDSDNDNILDGTELGLFFNSSDSQNDTIYDNIEAMQVHVYLKGTNVSFFISDSDPLTITNPINNDTDNDGIGDNKEDENYNGYFEDDKLETDPLNKDTDLDGITDGEEDLDKDGYFDEGTNETNPNDADTDDDGIKDGFEINRSSDTDEDGLMNVLDDDSDNDGILDGVEAGITTENRPLGGYGYNGTSDSYVGDSDPNTITNPLDNDTDDDGLPDGWIDGWIYSWDYGWGNYSSANGIMERWEGEDFNGTGSYEPSNFIDSGGQYLNETNPNIVDTDIDDIPDGVEAYFDLNPLNASDAEEDLDIDSISNLEEWRHGLDLDNDNLVNFNDTNDDNDLIDTLDEVYYGLNPYLDDMSWDLDSDGLTNGYEYNNSLDPSNPDTDGDNLWDGWHDDNSNGVLDWTDNNGNNIWDESEGEKPGEDHYGTNASDPDSDDDGIWDGDEIDGWYVYILPDFDGDIIVYHVVPNPLLPDEDDDNLEDWQEYENGTDPNSTDTDGDGFTDYWEITQKDEEDPTIVELNAPMLQSKPIFGHELKTTCGIWVEKAWLNMWMSIEDDIEIKKIYVDVQDTGQDPYLVFDGEEFTGWKVWGGYIPSKKIELDFWKDIEWEYTINITTIDVNNNSYSYFFLGGFKADFTGKFGSFIAEYNPFWGGFYTGYFEGLINTFGNTVSGFVDFLNILIHPDKWGEFIDMLTAIWDMIKDFNLSAIVEGAVYSTQQRAELFYPFTVGDSDWEDYSIGFVVGSGIGGFWATVLIILVSFKVGKWVNTKLSKLDFIDKFPKIKAIIESNLEFYNMVEKLPEKAANYIVKGLKWSKVAISNLPKHIKNVIPRLKTFLDGIKSGKARILAGLRIMKQRSSDFFKNLGSKSDDVWKLADDELRGCTIAMRGSTKVANDGGSLSIRILKNSKLQWTDDMLKKLDNVVAGNLKVAQYSDEAIDGLGKLLKKSTVNGEDVARRVLGYSDEVAEGTFKGINKGVIDDLYDVDAEDLAKYLDDFTENYPGANPFTHDEGISKMYKNRNIYYKGKDISGVKYLTNERASHANGKHLYGNTELDASKNSIWPTGEFDKSVRPDVDWDLRPGEVANDIPNSMTKEQVNDLVRECLDNPDDVHWQDWNNRWRYEYNPSIHHPEYGVNGMEVIVEPDGKIITYYPTSGDNVKTIGYNVGTGEWYYRLD